MIRIQRKAVAMIELIIAIVVMGLVLMTAPLLIERSVQSDFVVYQQESIAAASTQINMVMTRYWDVNNTDDTVGEPVLRTASSAITNCTTPNPPGVTSLEGRYCTDGGGNYFNASPIAFDSGYRDVDDYDGNVSTVTLYNSESYRVFEGDYMDKNISILTEVAYGDDRPRSTAGIVGIYDTTTTFSNPFSYTSAVPTNIKLINVTLTSTNAVTEIQEKRLQLGAFMCNIGAPKQFISNKGSL